MPWHCDVDLTRRTGRQFEPVTQCGGCAALLIVDALFPKQLVASECADVASIEGRSAKARGAVTGNTVRVLSTLMRVPSNSMLRTRAAPPGLFRNCQDGFTW